MFLSRWAVLGILCGPVLFAQQPKRVDDAALRKSASDANEWLTYGHDYAETHYSPLKRINASNVSRLGLAWSFETETQGQLEGTPLMANGVVYGTGTWSVVFAVDARTGKFKWRWDPEVSRSYISKLCCGPANRGLAMYNGRIYVGTLDGRLAALNQETGTPEWSVQTTDPNEAYSITGAPRIVKGKVIIGNGGAEFGVRGYVSAYDANTGKLAWRFYTIPGDPSKPFENAAMEKAAKTWHGEWWKMGGGGTAWDAFAYDPDADLLYVGTGNGGPWAQSVRSPGGGDNLYLSSILALRPDTGELVWYYQTTPGDEWDFTAVQSMILADLKIDGRTRKVIMQAPKNGFFYVLDRITGELISAEPYTKLNWATRVDLKTGRPVETPEARYEKAGPVMLLAGGGGAHNWHPMSFNPMTGLVYLPGQNSPFPFGPDPNFKFEKGKQNFAVTFNRDPAKVAEAVKEAGPPGFLVAWDPVAQKERWRIPYTSSFNGGSMTTAGNLVFHGAADGRFFAYSADKGEKLWEVKLAPGMATPITYEMDGKQYVSVMAGRGAANQYGPAPAAGSAPPSRMYTFVLDGKEPIPAAPVKSQPDNK